MSMPTEKVRDNFDETHTVDQTTGCRVGCCAGQTASLYSLKTVKNCSRVNGSTIYWMSDHLAVVPHSGQLK